MRAYCIESGVRIAPFGDLARDLSFGGVPLVDRQHALFSRFGVECVSVRGPEEIPSEEDKLVTFDNIFFTRRVLKSFLERWREKRRPSRLGLPLKSSFIKGFGDLQSFHRVGEYATFNLFGLPSGVSATDLDAVTEPLGVVYKEKLIQMPVPSAITGDDSWQHPITSSICFHVEHWIHVLQANLLSIQVRWVDEVVDHPLRGLVTLLGACIPGAGSWLVRLMGRANRIGKNVIIHPTARVEGSFIGDGARIGPQALVRGSIIGPGVHIEQRADVTFSVLGERCFVSKHSIVYATVAFDGASLCMKGMQMCLVGRRAGLTARASPIDTRPGERLKVEHHGRFEEIDLPVLGSCYGHDTFIGADIYIGPGRAIPNGVRIAPDPARVLTRVPKEIDPNRVYVVRNGTLETL